jgi:hypothetical protein
VQVGPSAWPEPDGPLVAGVSSFGFGGHQRPPGPRRRPRAPRRARRPPRSPGLPAEVLLPLSARSPDALRDLGPRLPRSPGRPRGIPARRGLHRGRAAGPPRPSPGSGRLRAGGGRRGPGGVPRRPIPPGPRARPHAPGTSTRPGLRVLRPGQASGGRPGATCWRPSRPSAPPWRSATGPSSSGRAGPSWRRGRPVRIARARRRGSSPSRSSSPYKVGLAALWRSWGIAPEAVVGHSLGEVAAAYVAGALTLPDAVTGRHAPRPPDAAPGRSGRTAAVGLSPDDARARLAGKDDRLFIAALNGPSSTTLSGLTEELEAFVQSLQEEGIFARLLDVDCAFHSPLMDPLRRELEDALDGIRPRPTSLPFVSTVTGLAADGRDLDAAYWGRNLREPVRFAAAIGTLADAHGVFLEIGPHPALSGAIDECLRRAGRPGTVLPSLRRGVPGRRPLLRSLGALYARGHAVEWGRLHPSGTLVRLPSYPWQRERFWIEPEESGDAGPSPRMGRNGVAAAGDVLPGDWRAGGGDEGTESEPLPAVTQEQVEGLLYEVQWRPIAATDPSTSEDRCEGRWLIFADAGGVGRDLGSLLEAPRGGLRRGRPDAGRSGGGPRRVRRGPGGPRGRPAAARRTSAGPTGSPAAGWSTSGAWMAGRRTGRTPSSWKRPRISDVEASCTWSGALADLGGLHPPRLWLVTRGAQPAGPGSADGADPGPLVGHGAVDRPGASGALGRADRPGSRRGRGGKRGPGRRAPRAGGRGPGGLPRRPAPRRPPGPPRAGRAVASRGLPAGGDVPDHRRPGRPGPRGRPLDGGAGGAAARPAGAPGTARPGGLGRIPADDASRAQVEAIRELERLGATVLVAAADVGDPEGMAALFDRLRSTLPPVRGVVHAAGVVRPRPVARWTDNRCGTSCGRR